MYMSNLLKLKVVWKGRRAQASATQEGLDSEE
jgi:hypothetical protein